MRITVYVCFSGSHCSVQYIMYIRAW